MQLLLFGAFSFGKNMEKQTFFWAAMAEMGKYHTSGYGWIGVYSVNLNYICSKYPDS